MSNQHVMPPNSIGTKFTEGTSVYDLNGEQVGTMSKQSQHEHSALPRATAEAGEGSLISRGTDVIERNPDTVTKGTDVVERHPDSITHGVDVIERNPDSITKGADTIERNAEG